TRLFISSTCFRLPGASTSMRFATSASMNAYPATMFSSTWSSKGSRTALMLRRARSKPRCKRRSVASTAARSIRRTAALSSVGSSVSNAKRSLDAIEGSEAQRRDLGRQGYVAEIAAVALPIGEAPPHKLLERCRLVVIGVTGVQKEPGVRRDRIGRLAPGVGEEEAEVLRHLAGRARQRGLTALVTGLDEAAGFVLKVGHLESKAFREVVLHVADRVRADLDPPGDPFVAARRHRAAPVYEIAGARPAVPPGFADRCQMAREREGRATALLARHDGDAAIRQVGARIGSADPRVVPGPDPLSEDVDVDVAGEAKRAREARKVIGEDDDAAGDRHEQRAGPGAGDLLVGEGRVA